MSKSSDLLATAFVLLAERHGADAAAHRAAAKTPAGSPVYTESEVKRAVESAATLATCSARLDRVNENECNGYQNERDEARDERAAKAALDKARAVAAEYGCGLMQGGDPRGSALKLATPQTGRHNTWGGASEGWALSL